jgi:hypothetical protein
MCRAMVEVLWWLDGPLRGQASLLQDFRIPVGARLAREGANAIQMDNRTAKAANVTNKTGTVNTIPTLK